MMSLTACSIQMDAAAPQSNRPAVAVQSAASTAMKREGSQLASSRLPEECQVCGTGANVRKNFGVPSCVSCRIFYSRNTGKQLICYQNGNCRIFGPSRKSCAACRFKKCLLAGMQKSRERKYKFKKAAVGTANKGSSAADSKQQQRPRQLSKASSSPTQFDEAVSQSLSFEDPTVQAPPFGLIRDIGADDETPLMDRSLFVHFYKMADMFCVPFECDRTSLMVTDTFSGLRLLEAVTKRTLSIIRFLPYFGELDRRLVSAMVSEKISGLISILRILHYHPATGIMTVRCAPSADFVLDPAAAAAGGPSSFDAACRNSADCLQQPLLDIVNSLFVDLTKGDCPLITDAEVATVYLAAARLYEQCHGLFRDRLNIGVVLLLGMYFFLPDYKTVQTDERELRGFQNLYLRCLQDLLKVLGRDAAEAMDMYNRILFLLTEVKSIDFYLSLLSRHVRVQPA